MRTHLNVLAWLHIAAGIFHVFILFVTGIMFGYLYFAGGVHFPFYRPAFMGMVIFIVLLCMTLAISGIITGLGLLRQKPWGRTLGIVASILDIVTLTPIYIALGIYGLVILLNRETLPLFEASAGSLSERVLY